MDFSLGSPPIFPVMSKWKEDSEELGRPVQM